MITISNPLPQLVLAKDPRYHGFGLVNMERTLATYGGWLEIQQTTGNFQLQVVIPKEPLDNKK